MKLYVQFPSVGVTCYLTEDAPKTPEEFQKILEHHTDGDAFGCFSDSDGQHPMFIFVEPALFVQVVPDAT